MMTVNEVSKLTKVSIRTLQYYDKIGLLSPADYTQSGYRMYDDASLETLQQILLFRELEFPLKDIKEIISKPDFNRSRALEQQIELLTLKRDHLDNLINFAREIKMIGVKKMDFSAFDTSRIDEYSEKAKKEWGKTTEYKEFEQKSQVRSKEEEKKVMVEFMKIFEEFGTLKNLTPDSNEAQEQVEKLKNFISDNFYTCSNEILNQLGQMYTCGGDFTTNIDAAGGEGTADFTAKAISIYCNM